MNKNAQNFWQALELKIGKYAMQIVGIIIFLIGSGFFVKYSIEKQLISPTVRILLCVITATTLIALSEIISRTFSYWTQGCCAGGIVLYYLSTYAAHNIYSLISFDVSYTAIIVITLLAIALSIRHNSLIIASISLFGFWSNNLSVTNPLIMVLPFCLLYSCLAYFKNWNILIFLSYVLYTISTKDIATLDPISKAAIIALFFIMYIALPAIMTLMGKRKFYIFDTIMVPLTSSTCFLLALAALSSLFSSYTMTRSILGIIFGIVYVFFATMLIRQNKPELHYLTETHLLISIICFALPIFEKITTFELVSIVSICTIPVFLLGLLRNIVFIRILSYASISALIFKFFSLANTQKSMLTYLTAFSKYNSPSHAALFLISSLILIGFLLKKNNDRLLDLEKLIKISALLKYSIIAISMAWLFATTGDAHFDNLIGIAIVSTFLGILGYFFNDKIIRYVSYFLSFILINKFVVLVIESTDYFTTLKLLILAIAIILSTKIIFLLEKYLKYTYLNAEETTYIKRIFSIIRAIAITAIGYNLLASLNHVTLTWENKKLAEWTIGKDQFYLWLAALYVILGFFFILLGTEFIGEILLVTAGYAAILFIHYHASTYEKGNLATWLTTNDALNTLTSVYYAISSLACILIGLRKNKLPLRLIGFGLIILATWKLLFVIMRLQLEYRILAFISIGIILVLASFIYQKLTQKID